MTDPLLTRNFSIIAHIDHGKSTLCDRILELTGVIKKGETIERVLDANPISRQRGITIKLAPVTMQYACRGQTYQFNMIDTPGHVDFSYEVSRSLAACEGAVLVVDASQGIQAQTLSYWHKAKEIGLRLIPVINKIDLPTARVEAVRQSLAEHFGFNPSDILLLSAKTGLGVEALLERLVTDIPPPKGSADEHLQALVFDSVYHPHQGVIVYLKIVQGAITPANCAHLRLIASQTEIKGLETGIFAPALKQIEVLTSGQVGYLATGMKDITKAQVGDTITDSLEPAVPLTGYRPPQPVVFLNFFSTDADDFEFFSEGLGKYKLNDASLTYAPVYSEALGKGYRCGFLGLLHAEIVQERLEREYNLSLVATQPSVAYQTETEGSSKIIYSASQLPPGRQEVREPITRTTIFVPQEYIGPVFTLCEQKRGRFINMEHFGLQVKLTYDLPLAEIMVDFFDKLKAASAGFASFDYEPTGYRPLTAVRLDIIIHHQLVGALSQIVPADRAYTIGRELVDRLAAVIPRQMFEFAIQAAIGAKVIASAKMRAFRKDVTAKLYGGDQTRKDKLLKKQAKGKKRMKQVGRVVLPQEAFLAVLKR